jgi:tRNA threonylcarbamoyladenosine biosynthesis protein TsaB
VRLLAFDSSGDRRSVALADGGATVAERGEVGARGHAERLVPLIDAVLADGGWAWSTIDRLVVAVGPGSFTGVRIAVAAARALALALDRPVHPVTTLDALVAAAIDAEPPVVPAIDARRGGLYVAWPDAGGGRHPPVAATPTAAAARQPAHFTAVGSGAPALVAGAGRGAACARAVAAGGVLAAARAAIAAGAAPLAGPAVRPLYVRAADAVPRAA